MFRRPSVHYGRMPEPVTPYQKAAQIWDERIGSARVQARNWRLMAFGCLTLKYFMPYFDLALFGWIFGLMSAQVLVINLFTAMRVFRALPLSGARLTWTLVLVLAGMQGFSLFLFRLVLEIAGDRMRAAAFLAPLVFPLLYFPAAMRFGMRVAQIGYALTIMVIAPFQLLTRDAGSAPAAMT